MRSVVEAAWKEKRAPVHLRAPYPSPDRFARVFRHLELHRPVCLALYDRHAVAHPVSADKIGDLQSDEVTAAQLAIDRQIEHRQIPEVASQFDPGPNRPDLLWKQWTFLTDQSPFVLGCALLLDCGKLNFGHELSSIRPSRSMRRHRVDRLILPRKPNGRFRNAVPFDEAALPQGRSEPKAPDAAKSINVRNPGGSCRLKPIPNLSHDDGGNLDQVSGICRASYAVGFDIRTAQFRLPPCYFRRPTRLKLDTGQAK